MRVERRGFIASLFAGTVLARLFGPRVYTWKVQKGVFLLRKPMTVVIPQARTYITDLTVPESDIVAKELEIVNQKIPLLFDRDSVFFSHISE